MRMILPDWMLLAFQDYLPFTKDGNLWGEPYKGYLYDVKKLRETPDYIWIVVDNHQGVDFWERIVNQEYYTQRGYIKSQKARWDNGERW